MKTVKFTAVLLAVAVIVFTFCSCGLLTPPVQSEIEEILAEDTFYSDRGLTIESVEFHQGSTNKFMTYQRVDFFAVTSSNEEYRLEELVLFVFKYDLETGNWELETMEHQDPEYTYFK